VHRAYAVRLGAVDYVVVEVENRSAVPFAVALAVRPYNPAGDARVREVRVVHDEVVVDGAVALVTAKPPARVAVGCDDVVDRVVGGAATPPSDDDHVTCAEARANAVLVFPLAHSAKLRVLAPLERVRSRDATRPAVDVPGVAQVVRGWSAQVERSTRIDLPDDRFGRALAAARHDLLVFQTGDRVGSWPGDGLSWAETARVTATFDQFGFHAEAERVLGSMADEQRRDGSLAAITDEDGWAAAGAVLYGLGTHWRLTRDPALAERLVGPIAKAAHWIEKRRGARRRSFFEHATLVDALWSVAGLRTIAPALAATGQPEVAEDAAEFGERLARELRRFERGTDGAGWILAGRLGVLAPTDERVLAAVEAARAGDGADLDSLAALDLACVGLLAEDSTALAHIRAVIERASPVATWPGHDPVITAAYCTAVRTMLVREEAAGLVLASVVPSSWLGQSWEVHGLPTSFGRLGFAVRWHGDRPALLWDLVAYEDLPPGTRLRAPGLDHRWSTSEPRGEALLSPIATPVPRGTVDGGGAEASSSFA
jgi:hypothetical protein